MIGHGVEPSLEVNKVVEVGVVESVLEAEHQVARDGDVARGNALLHQVSAEKKMVVQNPAAKRKTRPIRPTMRPRE